MNYWGGYPFRPFSRKGTNLTTGLVTITQDLFALVGCYVPLRAGGQPWLLLLVSHIGNTSHGWLYAYYMCEAAMGCYHCIKRKIFKVFGLNNQPL